MFTFGFYDSLNGDRKYNAEQFTSIFDGVIMDGVFANVGELLAVVAGGGMSVHVKPGRAWFDHTWNLNDSILPLMVDDSDVMRTRIDAVVLEVDARLESRTNEIKIVKGTPSISAMKPELINVDDFHQHPLAYVTIKPGVSEIKEEDIEIMVGKFETPFVTCPLTTVPIDDLFNQWNGEFNTWFDNVKAQLAGNIVSNLQKQIDEKVNISDKATAMDIANGVPGKWIDSSLAKNELAGIVSGLKIGDIVFSMRNLEAETNGKLIACDQRVVFVDAFQELCALPFMDDRLVLSNRLLIDGGINISNQLSLYTYLYGGCLMSPDRSKLITSFIYGSPHTLNVYDFNSKQTIVAYAYISTYSGTSRTMLLNDCAFSYFRSSSATSTSYVDYIISPFSNPNKTTKRLNSSFISYASPFSNISVSTGSILLEEKWGASKIINLDYASTTMSIISLPNSSNTTDSTIDNSVLAIQFKKSSPTIPFSGSLQRDSGTNYTMAVRKHIQSGGAHKMVIYAHDRDLLWYEVAIGDTSIDGYARTYASFTVRNNVAYILTYSLTAEGSASSSNQFILEKINLSTYSHEVLDIAHYQTNGNYYALVTSSLSFAWDGSNLVLYVIEYTAGNSSLGYKRIGIDLNTLTIFVYMYPSYVSGEKEVCVGSQVSVGSIFSGMNSEYVYGNYDDTTYPATSRYSVELGSSYPDATILTLRKGKAMTFYNPASFSNYFTVDGFISSLDAGKVYEWTLANDRRKIPYVQNGFIKVKD